MLSAVRLLRSSLNPAELMNGYLTMAFTVTLLLIAILRDVLKCSLITRINRAQPMDRHAPVSGRHQMMGWK
eukprot:8527956-Ditylum_brightwellii.AAC.1